MLRCLADRQQVRPVGVLALLLLLMAPVVSRAATSEQIISDPLSGLALYGFDPVSYLYDGRPRLGDGRYEYRFAGVTWRFENEGNRAAFAADPDVYVPGFGGYDPVAVARGAPAAGNPQIFVVEGPRFYLFHTHASRTQFLNQRQRALLAADDQWPMVKRQLVP